MRSFLKKPYMLWLSIFLSVFLIYQNFQANIFGLVQKDIFKHFEGSDHLVIGKIVADQFEVDTKLANLGYTVEGEFTRDKALSQTLLLKYRESVSVPDLKFYPYQSNYGLQGEMFSALFHIPGLNKTAHLKSFNALIFTIVLCTLGFCYAKLLDWKFALIFLITSVSSSWVTVFARSLYWIPFTWYLPALFAALACLTKKRAIFYPLIFLAFFVKSLMGYEYISSVTLFACSIFLIEPVFRKGKVNWLHQIRDASIVFLLCVAGFLCAVAIHAYTLGNYDFMAGFKTILFIASKRTLGDPDSFRGASIKAGLESPILPVIRTYIMQWNSKIFLELPGKLFPIMFFLSLASLLFKLISHHPKTTKHLIIFFVSLSVPLSWFIFGKAHSFIHVHLNYVLWYFGFITAMVYILTDDIAEISQGILKKIRPATEKESLN